MVRSFEPLLRCGSGSDIDTVLPLFQIQPSGWVWYNWNSHYNLRGDGVEYPGKFWDFGVIWRLLGTALDRGTHHDSIPSLGLRFGGVDYDLRFHVQLTRQWSWASWQIILFGGDLEAAGTASDIGEHANCIPGLGFGFEQFLLDLRFHVQFTRQLSWASWQNLRFWCV